MPGIGARLAAANEVVGGPQPCSSQTGARTALGRTLNSSSSQRDRFIKVNSPLLLVDNPQLNLGNHIEEQNASESGRR
jgi:hypothetical protein